MNSPVAAPHILTVDLGDRSYPIYIGSGLLQRKEYLQPHIPGSQVLVVSNETVAPLYLDQLLAGLHGLSVESVILPDGEQFKNLETWQRIIDGLMERRFSRQCTVVALGGGVVGDMAGFAAACYQRGVHFVQVPTTLLAQVDSSVGGKTGVNHPLGKNMIGAFYQPRCVLADTSVLSTLEPRQLSAGLAEVIKYGLIQDAEFFSWLEQNVEALLNLDPSALAFAIERSCRCKAEVVAADERESGKRALLNLGHTFGHAIETGMGYGSWLHGEAVAVGSCMAADLSRRLGWISAQTQQRIVALFDRARLPIAAPPELDRARFLSLMSVDKKVFEGKLRLVLLRQIGEAVVSDSFGAEQLGRCLNEYPRAET